MLTNNFYLLQAGVTLNATVNGKVVNPDGNTVNSGIISGGNYPQPLISGVLFLTAYNNCGVVVGSGKTPASKTDYKLENLISSGLTSAGTTSTSQITVDGIETVKAIILRNTSSADITISEIGMLGCCYSSGTFQAVLVDRTVLDNPITIPAGESKAISYTIRINNPA